ncbi:MAG: Ig-like domain-containing protein [Cytophagaceae bacterium]|jgi:hypothetical protein|nr:Ig-like domain-containing protein [Cytophagaceae bacterium]
MFSLHQTSKTSLLGLCAVGMLAMQTLAQSVEKLGSLSEVKNSLQTTAQTKAKKAGLKFAGESVQLNVRKSNQYIGTINNEKNSTLALTVTDQKIDGFSVSPSTKKAYEIYTENGQVYRKPKDIEKVMCIDFHEQASQAPAVAAPLPPAGSPVYTLQSFPQAPSVVYLDFDGEYVSGTFWNGGAPINAAPYIIDEDGIRGIWELISEDFRPFELNITTDSMVYKNAQPGHRMKVIFTTTNTAAPGSGGVAFIGSFNWTLENPCWVFNGGLKAGGETGSHEIGHTLFLLHDGRTLADGSHEEYYSGHGEWGPIMGASFWNPVTHWSNGTYKFANNQEDDMSIISQLNGFGFRSDDHANTMAGSTNMLVIYPDFVEKKGIIENQNDVDFFNFYHSGGAFQINVSPESQYTNLDAGIRLYNAAGTLLIERSLLGRNAVINTELAPGNYYFSVYGSGEGNGFDKGFTNYSSNGGYVITGGAGNTVPSVQLLSPLNMSVYNEGQPVPLQVTASDLDGSIEQVVFYVNGDFVYRTFTAPYQTDFNFPVLGTNYVQVYAIDNRGAVAEASATFEVRSTVNLLPNLTIESPTEGQVFPIGIDPSIYAVATDQDGYITKVDFYIDGNLVFSDNAHPYVYYTSSLANGPHQIRAVAFDNQGGTTEAFRNFVIGGPLGDIIGNDCLSKNQIVSFSVNAQHRPGATGFTWWFNGSVSYIATNPSNPWNAEVSTGPWYTGGQVCVGINYNVSPWYKQFCKTVSLCPSSNRESDELAALAASNVILSPNPTQDMVRVEGARTITQVQLVNALGEELLQESVNAKIWNISLSGYKSGMYFLKVRFEDGSEERQSISKTE